MTTLFEKDLSAIFHNTPYLISNTWEDLPELFKLSFKSRYKQLIEVTSDPNIYSSGRERFYFFAFQDDYALVGYLPSQCLVPTGPNVILFHKDRDSNIQIEEINLCSGTEFLSFIREVIEKGCSNCATEEDKKRLAYVLNTETPTPESANWFFDKFREIIANGASFTRS